MDGEIDIEILADGSKIKIDTGNMAGPNHVSAEKFMEEVKKLMGGEVKTTKKKHKHHHHAHERHHHHH